MIKIFKLLPISALFLTPFIVSATNLIEMPGNWLDMIATSSVPLFTAVAPLAGWVIGVIVVMAFIGMIIRALRG